MSRVAYCSSWANGVCIDPARSSLFEESSLISFKRLLQRIPHVVLGAHAYETLREKGVDLSANRIVLLTKSSDIPKSENVMVANSPAECLAHFPATQKNDAVLIGGGLKTIDSFMQLELIDEFILDIEPAISVAASPFFPSISRKHALELVGMRKIGAATIQLHYKVLG